MDKEKVLSYLNINCDKKVDKSMPKICLGFNVAFTVFIMVLLLMFCSLSFPLLLILFAILDALYAIFLILYRNHLWQFPLTFIGLLIAIIKLFYGYALSSQYEFAESGIPIITWVHILMLVVALGAIVYVWAKFYQAYKILKDNTNEAAKEIVASKNPMPKWASLIALFTGSPMIFVRLLRDNTEGFGIGIGFCFWILGLAFVVMLAMILPKCIVLIRFRVWKFPEYKKQKN